MAVCNDKVCDAKVACNECGLSLTPSMCGIRGLKFTESVCDGLKLIGADDVTINQGVGIDLSQGVHAYDGNGDEIEYTFVPSEIPKCAVGEHTVKYTVVGVANKMRPTICQRDRLHISSTCDDLDTLTKDRIVIIKQADPPKISGVEMLTIEPNTDFNPMDGVSAVDDNGNTVDVEFDGEYTKEASGEIASFETSLLKYMPKVEVSLEPIQDGTPWIDDEDFTEPYLLKASPQLEEDYNHESLSLVGGTVNWNQLVKGPWGMSMGSTLNVSGTTVTVTNINSRYPTINSASFHSVNGHKYLISTDAKYVGAISEPIYVYLNNRRSRYSLVAVAPTTPSDTWVHAESIVAPTTDENDNSIFTLQYNGTDYANLTSMSIRDMYAIDLTAFFGSATIADYIYSLEQANAGAGVAFFKSIGFDANYYAPNKGELMSVKTSGHKMVGFNQWDEEWELGFYDDSGLPVSTTNRIRNKNRIKVFPNTTYYVNASSNNYELYILCYDGEGNYIKKSLVRNSTFTTPANTHYVNFYVVGLSTYNNDICINLSWSGWRNGEYEPYVKHSYALDSSLTLRGIPKLDASNNLYYDGDTYNYDGSVERRYGIVDLGTLEWRTASLNRMRAVVPNATTASHSVNMITSKYVAKAEVAEGNAWIYNGFIYIVDSSYSDAATFKTAMSGVYLVYELATPTTENADPYTSPQAVFSGGTEEFIDTREVPIPVGNKTRYMRIVPIEGHDEVTVHTSSNNLVNEDTVFGDNGGVKQPNGSWYIADQSTLRNKVFFYNNGYEGQFTVTWIHKDTGSANWGTYPIVVYTDGLVETISMTKSTNAFRTETLVTRADKVVDHFEFTYASNNAGYYYLQLELGSTATEYQPYQGSDYTTDLGQTVYGGTLDVVSGVLTVDRAMVTFDGSSDEPYVIGSYGMAFRTYLPNDFKPTTNTRELAGLVSNQMTEVTQASTWGTVGTGALIANTNQLYFKLASDLTDISALRTYLASNPLQICYPLAEPQTYQLTPTEVNTLLGENNVWSDNGDIKVEYWEKMPNETIQFLEGVYHITYTAEDECGNKTEVTRDIIVGDGNVLCKARVCEAMTECGYS